MRFDKRIVVVVTPNLPIHSLLHLGVGKGSIAFPRVHYLPIIHTLYFVEVPVV